MDEQFQKQLYDAALRDGLTQAYNKRFLLERNVVAAEKTAGGVQIKTAEGDRLTGAYCIAADGINSRLAKVPTAVASPLIAPKAS